MAQVQGEHMFLMHCWHYGPWWQCLWFILLWWWVIHMIRLEVDSLMVFAWSLYCSWHIYGWGLLAGYMDDYSKLHCGDVMMMSPYPYDDKLFHAYVDWHRSSLLMIHGPCRSGWLWCFSLMIEWLYAKGCGHILMIHALIQVADDICYGADHTMLLLMFIMTLFRCLIMYIIRCKGHNKTHDVIMCLYLL